MRGGRAAPPSALIAAHQPDWVISAGFAGGLSENVKRMTCSW